MIYKQTAGLPAETMTSDGKYSSVYEENSENKRRNVEGDCTTWTSGTRVDKKYDGTGLRHSTFVSISRITIPMIRY
jgi:hypothetical protein